MTGKATNNIDQSTNTEPQFPVVGIGASAGGLEAVKLFIESIPQSSGMAFVFVQHLMPSRESALPEILKKISKIPVQEIKNNIHLEPDNFYVIPANQILTATDGILKLEPLDGRHGKANVIDIFFSSLAIVHQSYAVGIVLSGTLSDGSVGLQDIKAYGGITFAQDEESAAFDGMPRSAVNTGAVDFIMSPDKIMSRLIEINNPFHVNYLKTGKESLQQKDEGIFRQILTTLRIRKGVDFTLYKSNTLKRRIIRRMALNKIEQTGAYLVFLRESREEQDALYNDMLISVTEFFRDKKSFDVLCRSVFPVLLSKKTEREPLRIWVAGCATGQEAYSIAICLQEYLGDKTAALKIQIFATDISEKAIAKARTGIYRKADLVGISPSRLQQFFTKQDGNYQINKPIREMCVFAHHNILKDPPFSKVDFISCRNVLIYLETTLQKKALTIFNYALSDQGFLMLGKSESIGNSTDLFGPYNNFEKLYLRRGLPGRLINVTSNAGERAFRDMDRDVQKAANPKDILKVAEEELISHYAPAGVLVNEQFDIVQFRGATDAWLVPSPGKPSFNLIKMAREGLAFELRNLLHLAKKTNKIARKVGIFYKLNNVQQYVDMDVIPLKNTMETHYVVSFQNSLLSPTAEQSDKPEGAGEDPRNLRIEQLEQELTQLRVDMREISETQEAANEELQSANQELLSGSEELQSLNEELETSKEELQSTYEEIVIINKELIERNDQLNIAQQYAEAVVNTIRDPLLILDKDMKVKRATEGFFKKFRLTEKETIGLSIFELGYHQWDIPALRELLENILPEQKSSQNLEIAHSFSKIGNRILLLNARQFELHSQEKLVLVAFEDITEKRRVELGLAEVELILSENKERLRFAVEAAGLGTWDYNPSTAELIWDTRCKELFGIDVKEPVTYAIFISKLHPLDRGFVDTTLRKAVLGINSGDLDITFRTIGGTSQSNWLKAKGKAYFDEDGKAIRFIGTVLDITAQKLIDENTKELLKKKDEFISIASHELKTPITILKASLQLVEQSFGPVDNTSSGKLFLDKSIRQVDKIILLVGDLLDVTKIQSGKLEFFKTKFSFKELLDECYDVLNYMEDGHEIVLKGNMNVMFWADKNRLEQVVRNLVSNAVKYSPQGNQVIVEMMEQEEGIKVMIKDFGIGIDNEKLPFIFDRFYRVNYSSKKYSGLGLGLYISSEIITHHGGTIGVESTPGKGSTFWFTIPKLKKQVK